MINFIDLNNSEPYKKLFNFYIKAEKYNQQYIEALCISSFFKKTDEVNSRYVNLKFVHKDEFIFFTNYNSPKSKEFEDHKQICGVIFWNTINVQIRFKALIAKTSNKFNQNYFKNRSSNKNALAISSDQSKIINSYKKVKENYYNSLNSDNLKKCPKYWGGFSCLPYYFEFWEGHESRINKREIFDKIDGVWKHSFLQP